MAENKKKAGGIPLHRSGVFSSLSIGFWRGPGCLFFLLPLACLQLTAESHIKIVSFNIKSDPGYPFYDGWRQLDSPRKNRALRSLQELKPDLLCIQEAQSVQLADLAIEIDGMGVTAASRDPEDSGSEWMAIFFKTERLDYLKSGAFWLSATPHLPGSRFAGSNFPRVVSYALLRDRHTGAPYGVFCTHLDFDPDVRFLSMQLLREQIFQIAPFLPLIVLGDFNTRQGDFAYRMMIDGNDLYDSYRRIYPAPRQDDGTLHRSVGDRRGPRVDYIFLSHHFDTIAAGIYRRTYNGQYPSDHFPIWSTVLFEDERSWLFQSRIDERPVEQTLHALGPPEFLEGIFYDILNLSF